MASITVKGFIVELLCTFVSCGRRGRKMGLNDRIKTAAAVLLLIGAGLLLGIRYLYTSSDTSTEWTKSRDDSLRFNALSTPLHGRKQPTDSQTPPQGRKQPTDSQTPRQGRKQLIRTTPQLNKTFTPSRPKPIVPGCMDLRNIDRKRALVLGYRKDKKGFLTIGITTAKRKNASYLKMTLQSLIDSANQQERDQLRIVVFACDLKAESRQETHQIVSGFPEHLQSGLLQLIEAPVSFYLPLTNLKRTFNDPDVRVRWRSKETLDVVFLFAYSVGMSDYYMLLDDDLSTFPRYVQTIQTFVQTHLRDHWYMLDISERGTGKLFRDNHLLHIGQTLVEFYQEQPVDMLLYYFMKLWDQNRHFEIRPPLFKHFGQVSTLSIKNKRLGKDYI